MFLSRYTAPGSRRKRIAGTIRTDTVYFDGKERVPSGLIQFEGSRAFHAETGKRLRPERIDRLAADFTPAAGLPPFDVVKGRRRKPRFKVINILGKPTRLRLGRACEIWAKRLAARKLKTAG